MGKRLNARERVMSGPDKLLRAKVVFGGLMGSGAKTSLLKRMALGVFDDEAHPTIESNTLEKVVEVDGGVVVLELCGLLPLHTHSHT